MFMAQKPGLGLGRGGGMGQRKKLSFPRPAGGGGMGFMAGSNPMPKPSPMGGGVDIPDNAGSLPSRFTSSGGAGGYMGGRQLSAAAPVDPMPWGNQAPMSMPGPMINNIGGMQAGGPNVMPDTPMGPNPDLLKKLLAMKMGMFGG